MARGRLLNRTISTDDRLNNLSQEAMLLYLLTIPHLDRDGLIDGRPRVLWASAAPLRMDLLDSAPRIAQEWIDAGLVIRYNGARTPVLWFVGFQKNQTGMRYDREPPSQFAPPPGYYRDETGLQPIADPVMDNAGSLPEVCRKSAGKCPPEVEVEVEIEDQGQEGAASPPPPPAPVPSVDFALDGEPTTAKPDATTPKSMTEQPVIIAYRAVFQRFPSKAQMVQLLQHGINDMPRWDRALTAWLMAGYNPLNIGGMLDWYDNPELASGGPRSAAPSGARSVAKTTLNMQTIDAYFDRKENGTWTPGIS